MNIVINVKKKSLDKFHWAFLISWNGEKLLTHNKNLNLETVTANVTLTDKMLNIKSRNKPRIRYDTITSITQHYFRGSGYSIKMKKK